MKACSCDIFLGLLNCNNEGLGGEEVTHTGSKTGRKFGGTVSENKAPDLLKLSGDHVAGM